MVSRWHAEGLGTWTRLDNDGLGHVQEVGLANGERETIIIQEAHKALTVSACKGHAVVHSG